MSYASGHPVRLVGGRLALDFVNTADWSADHRVTHEKIATRADLLVWLKALDLGSVQPPAAIAEAHRWRAAIRSVFLGDGGVEALLGASRLELSAGEKPLEATLRQPLEALIAVSALSILADHRERARLKMCPGKDCGWLFLDETKNARRRWCMMETCGNRAKAARHYARRVADVEESAGRRRR